MRISELGGLQTMGYLAGKAGDTASDPEEQLEQAEKVAVARATATATATENSKTAALAAEVTRLEQLWQAAETAARKSPTATNKAKAAAALSALNAAKAALAAHNAGRSGRIKSAAAFVRTVGPTRAAQVRAANQNARQARSDTRAAGRAAQRQQTGAGSSISTGNSISTGGSGPSVSGGAGTGVAPAGPAPVNPSMGSNAALLVNNQSDPAADAANRARDAAAKDAAAKEQALRDQAAREQAAKEAEIKATQDAVVAKEGGGRASNVDSGNGGVMTARDAASGGGGGGGGGFEVGPDEAVPDPSLVTIKEQTVAPAASTPSTGGRTALYVGGALGALGLGFLAYKKFKKSGERT